MDFSETIKTGKDEGQDFKGFHALAYCNIHRLWANSLEL
jgi:desulfoferrodoxin (superoxide reductase-like protein)